MYKLESRLANQSDSDGLIANEAYDVNFTLLNVTGIVSRITFCPMKWVTLYQNLTFKTHFMIHTYSLDTYNWSAFNIQLK